MSDTTITFVVLGATVAIFVWDYLPVAGFGDPVVVFIASLFVVVMEPGGYRFGDYWKLGLPLPVLFGAVAVLLVPVIWSL
jgi:hypothetical protein